MAVICVTVFLQLTIDGKLLLIEFFITAKKDNIQLMICPENFLFFIQTLSEKNFSAGRMDGCI